jgi:hypothetical protein
MKNAIIDRLRHRQDFIGTDLIYVEMIARLHADWLFVEELMSSAPKEKVGEYASALKRLNKMLNRNMDSLGISYTMRRKIGDELRGDDALATLFQKLKEPKEKIK